MRKILLATTAIVGVAIAGAAQAAPASPITLNVGGYVDFVAGAYHEAQSSATTTAKRTSRAFETEAKLNVDASGKATNGIEYGANLSLWNGPEVNNQWQGGNNASNGVEINSAYVWMTGNFGKVLFGDAHGATDLFVTAPTVGEGQVDGRYTDFTDPTTLARFQASGTDNTEHSTKIAYYTPKVGNDTNKVQVGVSYTPNYYNYGQSVVKYNSINGQSTEAYQDVIDGAIQYKGNFHPVSVVVSADVTTGAAGNSGKSAATAAGLPLEFAGSANSFAKGVKGDFQDYTTFGLGAQAAFNGFTAGASYVDLGRYGTVAGQNQAQNVFTLGGKYEFDKVAVAASWLTGEGYSNLLAGSTATGTLDRTNYVSSFNAYGAGASYTWFPGLSSNFDGVLFSQTVQDQVNHNDGYVLLVSQKLAF